MLPPTLCFVHAHPDDEALFTAGASLHYAQRGYRCVLITCTYGQLGIDHEGRPGSHANHRPDVTRSTRAGELQRAAAMVGFSRVVTLGYDDSGMRGWPQNEAPNAFLRADQRAVAAVLTALFDELNAQVVVTYDERGFYGHPDHVTANQVTQLAVRACRSVERLYYPVAPSRVLDRFVPEARARGVAMPEWVLQGVGVDDDVIATTLDVARFAPTKQAAIATHASQSDNADLVTMDEDLFSLLFGVEYYQRGWSRRPAADDHDDLFGGLQ